MKRTSIWGQVFTKIQAGLYEATSLDKTETISIQKTLGEDISGISANQWFVSGSKSGGMAVKKTLKEALKFKW